MKRDTKQVREILDGGFSRQAGLAEKDVDAAMERAWEVLQPDVDERTNWAIPPRQASRRRYALIAAAAAVLTALSLFAIVRNRAVPAVNVVAVGAVVRWPGDKSSVVFLTDGSRIEMRRETEFSVERAEDGIRIKLIKGSVIINAAKQRTGHLYVQTRDVTVSVVGTVFLVNTEEKGSHVAVIEGEVRVRQGSTTTSLLAGEQLSTTPSLELRPVAAEVSWSQSAETHVALLEQTTARPAQRLEFDAASLRPIHGDEQFFEAMDLFRSMSTLASGEAFGDSAEFRCRGVDRGWSSQERNVWASGSAPLGRCIGIGSAGSFIRIIRELDYPGAVGNLGAIPDGSYQLNAVASDPRTTTRDQLLEMMKNFGIDRFKLKYHVETKIEDGWAVRVAPGGLKIKESSLDVEKRLDCTGAATTDAKGCTLKRTTIQKFFSAMAPVNGLILDGKVIDMTGLTGKVYEFTFNPTVVPPLSGTTGGRAGGGANIPIVQYNPPLEKQLEEQLGLTLKKEKVPVQYLVIDHAEPASEN